MRRYAYGAAGLSRLVNVDPLALEPRFMFDAAGVATGAEAAQDAAAQAEAQKAGADMSLAPDDGGNEAASSSDELAAALDSHDSQSAEDSRSEVVVVDPTVAGYQDLLTDLPAGVEVIVLNDGASVADMATALEGRSGLAAIHVISHGGIGALHFGGGSLTLDTIEANAEALSAIGATLAETGDILLYGCNVGQDGEGRAFIDRIASLTGADVAASDDPTGAADLGGDWDLEAESGSLEAGVVVSAAGQAAFDGTLATFDFTDNTTTNGSNQATQTVSGVTLTMVSAGGTGHQIVVIGDGGGVAGTAGNVLADGKTDWTTNTFTFTDADGQATAVNISQFQWGAQEPTGLVVSFSPIGGGSDINNQSIDNTGATISPTDWTAITGFTVTRHSGSSGNVIDNIQFTIASDPPSIGNLGGDSLSYNEGDGAVVVDQGTAATVTDSDSADFDGGNLTVTIASGEDAAEDVLSFDTSGDVSLAGTTAGSNVSVSGSVVGTLANNIAAGNDLVVNFNGNATPAGAQALVQAVTYQNTDTDNPTTGARTVRFTVNDGDGATSSAADVTVTVSAVNDDPTASGVPSDVTMTEDTESNVDLSAISFADVDGDSITVTLTASAGTFSTPADGAGNSVTETLVNATTVTLVGTAANINTYLDTASNLRYTPAEDVSGNNAATIAITANDGQGSGDVAIGTVNVDVTAVNDDPTASGVPSDVTVTEDTESNVDLSAISFADVDGDSITVTLTASAGTFSTPADGAGNGVTETLVNATTVTLVGTAANINTYLDTASNIRYTPAEDVSGNNAATISITANDGQGSGDVAIGTVNIDITAVNDAPVVGNLGGDNSAVQAGGSAVNIDSGGDATVSNVDSADYDGGSLTIVDNGNNNTADGNFAVDGTNVTSGGDGTIAAGETIAVGGTDIGTVDATNDGQVGNSLTINFNSDATNARVQTLLRNITWGAGTGSGAQTFTATLNDGDGTANGGDQDTAANFTMTLGNLPAIGNLGGDSVSFQEGDDPVALDAGGNATLTDADNPGNLDGGNLTATVSANAQAGEDILTFDTTGTVALAGTTAGSNVSVGGTVVGTLGNNIAAGNDLVVNFNANATVARVQTLLRAVAYDNDSQNPTESTRSVQVTVTDNTGLTSAAATASVAVSGANDAPTDDSFVPPPSPPSGPPPPGDDGSNTPPGLGDPDNTPPPISGFLNGNGITGNGSPNAGPGGGGAEAAVTGQLGPTSAIGNSGTPVSAGLHSGGISLTSDSAGLGGDGLNGGGFGGGGFGGGGFGGGFDALDGDPGGIGAGGDGGGQGAETDDEEEEFGAGEQDSGEAAFLLLPGFNDQLKEAAGEGDAHADALARALEAHVAPAA